MLWRFFKLDMLLAAFLLTVMAVSAFSSSWGDTLTYDEDAHIGAAVSYITQKDMRLNPEHPPLVKDLAALPLLFIPNLIVPTNHPSWIDEVNGQWNFGKAFLFESGNDADLIVRLARIMPMVLMLLLGAVLFWVVREIGGTLSGLFALALFVFSPTILAHGRLVTTDVAAALGAFLATYLLLRYFAKPTWKRLFAAGIAFGIAEALKFSLILLIPYFAVLAFAWWLFSFISFKKDVAKSLCIFLGGTVLVGIIGYMGIVYPLYMWHVWDYPQSRQVADIRATLANNPNQTLTTIPEQMARNFLLRPLAQYAFGITMATQRVAGGNTTYFLREVSAEGRWYYFPIVFALKEPTAMFALVLLALMTGLYAFRMAISRSLSGSQGLRNAILEIVKWKRKHFVHIAFLLWILFYLAVSIKGNLNIGIRHLIPIYPFLFALTAIGLAVWLKRERHGKPGGFRTILENTRGLFASGAKGAVVAVFFGMLAVGTIRAWPYYLTHFNILGGGSENGYVYVVDSNLDWGQDLKRLANFVEENNIKKIAIDYFGLAPPEYYIKNAVIEHWWAERGRPSGWFAVSATFRQGQCARPGQKFQGLTRQYCFLNAYTPIAVIGHSIFVYNFSPQ